MNTDDEYTWKKESEQKAIPQSLWAKWVVLVAATPLVVGKTHI